MLQTFIKELNHCDINHVDIVINSLDKAAFIIEVITYSHLVRSKTKISANLENPYYISATFQTCFFS